MLYGAGVAVGACVMLAGHVLGLPIVLIAGWLGLMYLAQALTRRD